MQGELSRRHVMVRAAAAAAGIGLALSMSATARRAQAKVNPEPDAEADVATLNALLNAEYDAIATYTVGAGLIAADTDTDEDTRDAVTGVAVHFQTQHKQHAAALKKLIEDSGGTPAEDEGEATIPASFPANPTTADVIKLAADKEKHAAYTYAQVVESLSTQAAAKLVASIGAVETQHFVVLHGLAEGLISPTDKIGTSPQLVVPAAFILDVGGPGTQSLEDFPALDELLEFDPPA